MTRCSRTTRQQDGRGARLITATLWRRTRRRAGDVLDSRRGTVRWSADDGEHAFDIVNPFADVVSILPI